MPSSPYYFAENRPSDHTRLDSCPGYVLRARQPSFYGEGPGLVSVKMFLGGAAQYRVGNGGAYRVDDSCYLMLNHGQEYSITIDSPAPVESFCLFFSREMAEDVAGVRRLPDGALLDDPKARGPLPCFYERTYPHGGAVSAALFSLRESLRRLPLDASLDPLWLTERMHEILQRLVTGQDAAQAEARGLAVGARTATREELYCRLHRARDFIAACFDQPLSLDDISRIACLSPNHLLRTFGAAFGQTPHQYLTACRLSAARALLERSDLPVTHICLQVGFISLGSFSHLFSRRVGVSPETYRRRFR